MFLALSLSDVVFILLMNDKNAKNCSHLNIYKQDKFRAQLSWAWKQFYNLGAEFVK